VNEEEFVVAARPIRQSIVDNVFAPVTNEFVKVARRSTCALIEAPREQPRKTGIAGTGTFVQIGEQRCILTASHVISDTLNHLFVHAKEMGPGRVSLRGLPISRDTRHDTALIHLPAADSRLGELELGWRFTQITSAPRDLSWALPYFLLGFPEDETRIDIQTVDAPSQHGKLVHVDAMSHRIVLTLGQTAGPREIPGPEPLDPRIDFFLTHPRMGMRARSASE
jgi:hypothetical protein